MHEHKKQTKDSETAKLRSDAPEVKAPEFNVSAKEESPLAGGFSSSQARLQMLIARKSDLEIQLQFINQQRMQLANVSGALFQQLSNLDPQSPEAQSIQSQLDSIQSQDKALEIQAQQLSTQIAAIEAEIEALRQQIQDNTEGSFQITG